jgi:hypothetical protein
MRRRDGAVSAQYVPPKCQYTAKRAHGITTQKTTIYNCEAVSLALNITYKGVLFA